MKWPKILVTKVKDFFSKEASALKKIIKVIEAEIDSEKRDGVDGVYAPDYYQLELPNKYKKNHLNLEEKLKAKIKKIIKKKDFKIRGDLEADFVFTKQLENPAVRAKFRIKGSDIDETKDSGTKIFKDKEISDDQVNMDATIKVKPISKKKSYLILKDNNQNEKAFINSVETNIGRQETNEITLTDPSVSRVHAQIINKKYYYLIRDLDSTNGLFVNGELVKEKKLTSNDKIKLGEAKLEFYIDKA